MLPLFHALSGCDTVAKVGTKPPLLKLLETDDEMLQDFGQENLNEDTIIKAEQAVSR